MLGEACHHRPLTAYLALDVIRHGMQSLPLDNIHDWNSSGLACKNRPWIAHTAGRRQAWHATISLGQHTRSDDVRH